MYSASDFERFSKRILTSAQKRAREIVAEAAEYADKRMKEAETEARERYASGLEALKKEASSYEKERRAAIETALKVSWQNELAKRKRAVLQALEKRISEVFETLALCFLQWLKQHHGSGRIDLYESLPREGLESFDVRPTSQKMVRLTRGNLIVAFTPDSVMEEFERLIDETLSTYLKAES